MKKIALITLALSSFFLCTAQAKESAAGKQETKNPTVPQLVPYAVDQALEAFSQTVHGGIMHITAKPGSDAKQIKLIQQYLRKTAEEFKKGDFSSTERFHGTNMPGLAQMKSAKADDIRYEYKALQNGGQIHFSTEYPHLLNALHAWIAAQIKEHGNAVLPEHEQHHSSPAE